MIETARAQVAELIGAQPREIIFTSCATESNNAAIHAALKANPGKRHIVTSQVEQSAVLNQCNPGSLPETRLIQTEKARAKGTSIYHLQRSKVAPQNLGSERTLSARPAPVRHLQQANSLFKLLGWG